MLQNAPSCPECASSNTQWRPATSDGAFVDYFRCDTCGRVWVVGTNDPQGSHQISPSHHAYSSVMFLFVNIEAGLLFAAMAQTTDDDDKRRQLHERSQKVFDAMTGFRMRVKMTDDEQSRVKEGLTALSEAIRKVYST